MNRGYHSVQLPQLTPVNKYLIITSIAVFIVQSALKGAAGVDLLPYLGLSAPMLLNGHIHQLITYSFIGGGLMEVLFTALLLWFIGSDLEYMWGKKKYITLAAVSAVGGGLFFVLVNVIFFSSANVYYYPLHGLAGVANAYLLAYAFLFPTRQFLFMFIIPMQAKYFCWILIGIQVYMGVFSPAGSLAWGHLGAMGMGWLYMRLSDFAQFQGISLEKLNLWKKGKKSATRHHLKLVREDDDDTQSGDKPPRYWQ